MLVACAGPPTSHAGFTKAAIMEARRPVNAPQVHQRPVAPMSRASSTVFGAGLSPTQRRPRHRQSAA